MGIHKFFSFLRKTFPRLILKKFELSQTSHIEGLYIDLNSPLHNIAQRLFKYGLDRQTTNEDRLIDEYLRSLTPEQKKELFFECVGTFLYYAYKHGKPTKIFMIAVDGVAPKAKMVQQRLRRFSSKTSGKHFDSNMLSPGTKLMDELDVYIRETWMVKYRDKFDSNLTIVYSSHREPGEGEHKIFHQMNEDLRGDDRVRVVGEVNKSRSIPYQMVLGADSDLIVISLARTNNIMFMRDNLKNYKNPEAIDPLELAVNEVMKCSAKAETRESLEELNRIWDIALSTGYEYANLTEMRKLILDNFMAPNDIIDFTFVSMMLGNDFIPAVPEFDSVTVMGNDIFENEDIETRYKSSHIWRAKEMARLLKEGKAPPQDLLQPVLGQKGEGKFDAESFWKEFNRLSTTWNHGETTDINYAKAQGIYYRFEETTRFEMFPFQLEPLTENSSRVLMFKRKGERKWEFAKIDVGSMKKMLDIYRHVMTRSAPNAKRKNVRGQTGHFLVDKSEINYLNLLTYFRELEGYAELFLKSNAIVYKDLEGQNLIPNPLAIMSIGVETKQKRVSKKTFVPAAYSSIQNARAFGIYDQNYADMNLPKQAVDEMCRKWLEGVQWTLRYYSLGLKSINTEWFYPYFYSPSIRDLISFIENRIIVSVPEFPGIQHYLDETTVSVHRIQIAGVLTARATSDPSDPGEIIHIPQLNRQSAGIIYRYRDNEGKLIHLFKPANGEDKFIDMGKVHITKGSAGLLLGRRSDSINSDYDRIDLSKAITLVEISREDVREPVEMRFALEESILSVISDISRPYASVFESLFSIMPVRLLKLIMSPWMVDFVVDQISDCFPYTVEKITEGIFYKDGAVPKIPFPSPIRIRRAIDSIPREFDVEIARFNVRKERVIMIRNGDYGPQTRVISTSTVRKNLALGYAQPNIAVHTRKKQEDEAPEKTELSVFVTSGYGDVLGIVLPQYVNYYRSIIVGETPQSLEEIIRSQAGPVLSPAELIEEQLFKNHVFEIPNGLRNPSQTGFSIDIMKGAFSKHPIVYPNVKHDLQRQLLINWMLFMSKYGSRSNRVVCVNVGSGEFMAMLSDFFPRHEFEVWDAGILYIPPEKVKGPTNQTGKIIIHNEVPTPVKLMRYRGQGVLFLSNFSSEPLQNRDININNDRQIIQDNFMQNAMIVSMNPSCSILKFNLPDEVDQNYKYIRGEIWLPVWNFLGSTESYLIVDSQNYVKVVKDVQSSSLYGGIDTAIILENYLMVPESLFWNAKDYLNRMFYFNLFVKRTARVTNGLGIREGDVKGLLDNFDCSYEIYVWEQWILQFPNGSNFTIEQRKAAVLMILDAVEKYLGYDMSINPIVGQRQKHNLPFLQGL